MIDACELARQTRDQALEEAAQVCEARDAGFVGAAIRARKGDVWATSTPPAVQRALGNRDATD